MDDYSIFVDTLAPEPAADINEPLDTLMDLLAGHHGVVNGDGRGWGAVVSVDTTDVKTAYAEGMRIIIDAARRAGLPAWPVVDVRVVRGDVLDAENHAQHPADLVSGPDAARILGVTRQRIHQLRREDADFPTPLYELGAGPVWARSHIEAFAHRWARSRRGRVRRTA